ncbi:MAG: type II toxin-antitoxin system VapC family toxin [Acidobacteriota bacterium]
MKILIDTQSFLWFFLEPHKLGNDGKDALTDTNNELYLSAARAWEISIKYGLGKIALPEPPDIYLPKKLLSAGIIGFPIEFHHVLAVYSLPLIHKDPFDRLIIAQTKIESLTLLTADPIMLKYTSDFIWSAKPNP